MKILLSIIFQLLLLSSCNAGNIDAYSTKKSSKAPNSIKKIMEQNSKSCSILYNSKKIWVLEQHCAGKTINQGIFITDALGTRSFHWYDPNFNKWAWQEGCNSEKDCFYKVTTNKNGEVTELTFYFYINLSEGFYKLKIKNKKLVVTEKKIIDHPS